MNYCTLFNIHISRIYHISYPIILKINVLTYQDIVISDTHIVSVHHRIKPINLNNAMIII